MELSDKPNELGYVVLPASSVTAAVGENLSKLNIIYIYIYILTYAFKCTAWKTTSDFFFFFKFSK